MKELRKFVMLLLYVAGAGAVFSLIEKSVGDHVHSMADPQGPTAAGVWTLDRLIFIIVLAAIVRDDLTDFVAKWRNPSHRSWYAVLRVMAYGLLAAGLLGASVYLVAELRRTSTLS